ncbi:MAG: D-alanyl-D-alanine carboxypeptidase family protein [Actinomycetota bacterium]
MPRTAPRAPGAALASVLAVLVIAAGPAVVSRAAGLNQAFPPPTPVPPDGSLSPYPTALATPPPSDEPPELRAEAAALVDLDAGQVLFARDGRERRPIASLTKIMTALVVLELVAPGDPVTASAVAAGQSGAELGLVVGETLPARELLYALLLQSANDAAVALAEHVEGSVAGFVDRMNDRAEALGLEDTEFFSPNGLDDRGFSTAVDLARLTRLALDVPEIARIVGTKVHDVPAPEGEPRHIQNRNALLWLYRGALGVKTGFTTAAGFCLIVAAERDGERLVAVVLGEPSQAWDDAATLMNYGFEAFERRAVVSSGEALEPVSVQGYAVPAVAGRTVYAYVDEGPVRIDVRPLGGLKLPVQEGQRLGLAVVRVGGAEIGRIPVRVGDLPEVPGTGLPLWRRVAAVLVALIGRMVTGT